MMIFSLVVMIGLEKCCITSAYLQWLCHSGERAVARGPLVFCLFFSVKLYFCFLESVGGLLSSNSTTRFIDLQEDDFPWVDNVRLL